MCVCRYVLYMYARVHVPVWLGFCYLGLQKLKSDYNQTWVKDAIGVPSYVDEVRGHVPRVKGHLRSSLVENVGFRYLGLL